MKNALLLPPLCSALLVACDSSDSDPLPDAGAQPRDLGTNAAPDAAPRDAGLRPDTGPADLGSNPVDAGPVDLGSNPLDLGTPEADAGGPLDAAAPIDAGPALYSSCLEIKTADAAAETGVYQIDVAGELRSVFCDMELEGGGYTLALLKNSAHQGTYPDFGANPLNTSALAQDPAAASTSTIGVVAWLDLNDEDYTELRLAAYNQGTRSFLSEVILRSSLRIAFGEPGYYLYDDPNGYYWCGGPSSYTDQGVGQVNQPAGAPSDCKGHTVLGGGWDFGTSGYNTNMTMCGSDGYNGMLGGGVGGAWTFYPNPGVAYAIWIR